MRAGLLVLIGAVGIGAYLGRGHLPALNAMFSGTPEIVARPAPGQSPTAVYKWTDAQGNIHYGDAPAGTPARRVELAPLNTVKGMSRAEIDAALKPAAQTLGDGAECAPEDAKCIRQRAAPRNLALERMETATGNRPLKP